MPANIRESTSGDFDAIVAIYPHVFPDEDLVPVVSDLLEDTGIRLALVATTGDQIAGNVIFTTCGVEGSDAKVALLGPLAVAPDCQRQGIGSLLVRAGLQQLAEADFDRVCVLGDPAYYGRLGFVRETGIETPYPMPAEWDGAWQSQPLGDASTCAGKLVVPPPWQHPELWSG
jgi:putative acetyltransferase